MLLNGKSKKMYSLTVLYQTARQLLCRIFSAHCTAFRGRVLLVARIVTWNSSEEKDGEHIKIAVRVIPRRCV